MDPTRLDLPSLEQLLVDEHAAWELAEKAGKTLLSWPENEVLIRRRYAELQAMTEEQRDVTLTQGHLEKVGMLQSVLDHVNNVLLPRARAKEAAEMNRAGRRASKKKKKKGARR